MSKRKSNPKRELNKFIKILEDMIIIFDDVEKENESKNEALQLQNQKVDYDYLSALNFIGDVRTFLKDVENNYKNTFGACVFCKRHESYGHLENCSLDKIKRSLDNFDTFQKS